MWTRFIIECETCSKTTNFRFEIPMREEVKINFKCLECESEIRGKFSRKKGLALDRGKLLEDAEFLDGDFFYEFSDTLPTKKPSRNPHDKIMPTLRIPTKEFFEVKEKKDLRMLLPKEGWDILKDLSTAYANSNNKIVEKLSKRLLEGAFGKEELECNIELDFERNYFVALNNYVFPWIDFDNHKEFVYWNSREIFKPGNFTNSELLDFVTNQLSDDKVKSIKKEISDLIKRFIELRELFHYAYNKIETLYDFTGREDFVSLKNFYTDCFEFMGRSSSLIFRLQNFQERNGQNNVPLGAPRNITNASDFEATSHGNKLDILLLSSDVIPKKIFDNSFDSKLRNGINHYKAKLDKETQIISYYPITRRPEREFQISYIDFLNKCLDVFNSVLKIGQVIKHRNIFNEFRNRP